jgi:hypothetical protein
MPRNLYNRYRAWPRSASLLATAGLACLASLGLLFATAQPSGAKVTNKKVKKSLKRQLKKRDYESIRVSGCNDNKKRYICRWYAQGTWPGEVPYKCREKARYRIKRHKGHKGRNKIKGKRWLVPTCGNRLDAQIPLLPQSQLGPQPRFGYNELWNQHLDDVGTLPAGGADTARTGLTWHAIERERGLFKWAFADNIYNRMLAQGIRPLWVLGAPPCWAQNKLAGCNEPAPAHPTPDHYDEMASFAAAAAVRYPESVAIEVTNEPNTSKFWGGPVDPAAYSKLFKQVGDAIDAANPEMPVVTGGLASSYTDDGNGLSTATFLNKLYEHGAAQEADAVGIHVYPHKPYNDDYIGSVRIRLGQELAIMQSHGAGNQPMWITETGISTAGQDQYTQPQQADALVRIYNLYRRVSGLNIPVVIVHRYQDQVQSGFPNERGYGVFAQKGHPKQSYCALAAARGKHPC